MLAQEARLHEHKRAGVLAWLAANKINRIVVSGGVERADRRRHAWQILSRRSPGARRLGLDESRCNALGLRLYKLGGAWPIEPADSANSPPGSRQIIVVEEKRSLIEAQLREELYGAANPPVCVGKRDENGQWLFPAKGALDPNDIAIAIGERLLKYVDDAASPRRSPSVRALAERTRRARRGGGAHALFLLGLPPQPLDRRPRGRARLCRHRLPFHGAVSWTAPPKASPRWAAKAPIGSANPSSRRAATCSRISATAHTIIPARWRLRWAIDAKVNITYKILFNDAVAMTGGQRHEGGLNVPQIAAQVTADGAKRVVVVTDESANIRQGPTGRRASTMRPREELIAVEKELSEIEGVTVLIYDQTCAAEKRRRRKRGQYPDPDKRAFINERVCEGCGDCGVKSNCVSVQPLRDRIRPQAAASTNRAATRTFPASTASVRLSSPSHGATPEGGGRQGCAAARTPEPARREIGERPYAILITGVGGTGVVTIGAILAMAAHLENKGAAMIDMAGLAQKGGAVFSHVKLARGRRTSTPSASPRARLISCSAATSSSPAPSRRLAAMRGGGDGRRRQQRRIFPGDFTRKPDFSLPAERVKQSIQARCERRRRASWTRARRRPRCSALRSAPTCSCSATPIRPAMCH